MFTVYRVAGCVKHRMFEDDYNSCLAFCNTCHWHWVDENGFEWDLEIV